MVELRNRQPLVLIASHGEWVGRSVVSVLELNGYAVLRVDGGRRQIGRLGPGEFFGELGIATNRSRNADVVAATSNPPVVSLKAKKSNL